MTLDATARRAATKLIGQFGRTVALTTVTAAAYNPAVGAPQILSNVQNFFTWLGSSLAAPANVNGSPVYATYVNLTDGNYVTRGGLTMRIVGGAFASNNSFAGAPYIAFGASNNYIEFDGLELGTWDIGIIIVTDTGLGGLMQMTDNPGVNPTVRYSYTFPTISTRLMDTDGTSYIDSQTAFPAIIDNLTFVQVLITDSGNGKGKLRISGGSPFVALSGVALRKAGAPIIGDPANTKSTVNVKAIIEDFSGYEIANELALAGDKKITVSAADLISAPKPIDTIAVDGKVFTIVGVKAISSGVLDALYELQVRLT